jgi:hypothetical protein
MTRGRKIGLSVMALFVVAVAANTPALAQQPSHFPGNFTPIPKNKIVQNFCPSNCQLMFLLCLSVCGNGCTSTSSNKPPISRNCDFELDACQRGCLSSRSG